jgi:ATP-dependent exoDNAse (exonuclease V) beta subunit
VFLIADKWIESLDSGKRKKMTEEEKNLLYIGLTRSTDFLGFIGATAKELIAKVSE